MPSKSRVHLIQKYARMSRYQLGLPTDVVNLFASCDVPSTSLRFIFYDTIRVLDGRQLDMTVDNVRAVLEEMQAIAPGVT